MRVPITCPMSFCDIEHLAHLFFDCPFAAACWEHVNMSFNWQEIEFAPDWLLEKITALNSKDLSKVCMVLWGIWHWRNKKIWNEKVVSPGFAMDSSLKVYLEWVEARKGIDRTQHASTIRAKSETKWKKPEFGFVKINVDASVFIGAPTFTIGMVVRDHNGEFFSGKTMCLPEVESVFEAETIGIREALTWLKDQQFHLGRVIVETDFMLTVSDITGEGENNLEVQEALEDCKQKLSEMPLTTVRFVRKNANRVAHEIVRFPCLANDHIVFTSPPTCVLEALTFDRLN
ncbi:uncharacterized protein LOC141703719 [Apium graveolens]|uniref:uncharacterized protein LOC141703719 n=1 Tax=Apium graveolens TaxID=4045 RepID=UPI003D79576C